MVVSTSWLKIPEKVIELSTGDSGFVPWKAIHYLEKGQTTKITDIPTSTDIIDLTDITDIF